MNAITQTKEQAPVQVADYSASLMQVIAKAASDPNVDIDKMERLLQMQERVAARDAEAKFNAAFSAMQPNLPHITVKNKIVHNGRTISEYADWPSISAAITPILSEYGFSLNFGGSNDSENKTTIAKLRHSAGHVETNSITLPHDTSGSKNKVQAIGSSSTYGQRYSACPLVGVVVHGSDDDGVAAQTDRKLIDDGQWAIITDLIEKTNTDARKFCAAYGIESVKSLPAAAFDKARKQLNAKLGVK